MTDLNLADFYNYHLHHSADASVLVAERTTSRYFVFDSSRRLQGWENVTTGETRPEGFVPSACHPTGFRRSACDFADGV